jgi:anti-anti-sigma factor
MASTALTVAETHDGNVCIVSLSGRIDSTNANELITRFNGLIASGEKSILVDLGAVLYLTSAAFRAFLVAADEAERNQSRFVLCGVAGHVRELFEMGGLLDAFTIYSTRDDAVTMIR